MGYSVAGPSAPTIWLRIVKRTVDGEEHYTPYSSTDGRTWERGGTWTHQLGRRTRLGLAALGEASHRASFEYVRVFALAN